MTMNVLFQNQHYLASGKPGLLVVENLRKPAGKPGRGVALRGDDATEWLEAFEIDKADRDVCAAYCRAILN